MVSSESVQYFQFDNDGNMFVFEPGAGFSGQCKHVESGFEWEANSSQTIWSQEKGLLDASCIDSSNVSNLEEVEIKEEPEIFSIPSQR